MSVKNPSSYDSTGCWNAIEWIKNKHTCVVHWVQFYGLLYPPDQEQFYSYKAHGKLLKVSLLFHFHYYINFVKLIITIIFFYRNTKNKCWISKVTLNLQ